MLISVFDLIGFLFPGAKAGEGFLAHHLNHRNLAQRMGLRDLAIDKSVVEADLGGVRREVAEVNVREASPVNRAQTHGARLARSVEIAVFEFECPQLGASRADRGDLRVSGWIAGRSHAIYPFRYDRAVFHYDRTERSAASVDVFHRKLDGACHKRVVHEGSLSTDDRRANRSTWTLSQPLQPENEYKPRREDSGRV